MVEQRQREEDLHELGRALRELSSRMILFHHAVAETLGLNTTDHQCMDLLGNRGPMTAGELAAAAGLTTGAITGVIDRLAAAGYVQREKDARDRRRVIVRPVVPHAAEEVMERFAPLRAGLAEICADYGDRELAVIIAFTAQCSELLRQETLRLRSASPD